MTFPDFQDEKKPVEAGSTVEQTFADFSDDTYTVTIYASSSSHIDDVYFAAARETGKLIAEQGWIQVNGGGLTGLMGAATDGGVESGGIVDAVIPEMFFKTNMSSRLRKVLVTPNMTERKNGLLQRADAIICLPGGLGTLEEVFEALSWRQLGLHSKPIVFLNVNNFYALLEQFLRGCINTGFVSAGMRETFAFCSTPCEAITYLKNFSPKPIDKTELHHIFSGRMVIYAPDNKSESTADDKSLGTAVTSVTCVGWDVGGLTIGDDWSAAAAAAAATSSVKMMPN
eukprot:CAMPEP_0184695808 /NCGR_PEP_ID=MMETSP0313-20130426/3329_1 /TAXON_ID=2792 /ORGANISM="Porphyridium aerugineum, Strain SAG 1380-2" /LENGTH=284 /DNA_ID=CAMNT_0027154333 /DNA_START=157 /DNA_END=1011 /DNA_ORIENTATION=-